MIFSLRLNMIQYGVAEHKNLNKTKILLIYLEMICLFNFTLHKIVEIKNKLWTINDIH